MQRNLRATDFVLVAVVCQAYDSDTASAMRWTRVCRLMDLPRKAVSIAATWPSSSLLTSACTACANGVNFTAPLPARTRKTFGTGAANGCASTSFAASAGKTDSRKPCRLEPLSSPSPDFRGACAGSGKLTSSSSAPSTCFKWNAGRKPSAACTCANASKAQATLFFPAATISKPSCRASASPSCSWKPSTVMSVVARITGGRLPPLEDDRHRGKGDGQAPATRHNLAPLRRQSIAIARAPTAGRALPNNTAGTLP
mmetsp:Transcript_118841/g.332799  ORF Transcript_118841/g.332799 Transcript_118841/m.332799 type:complete len:256 (-) Transcript_118841:6-773(-)